MLWKILAEQLDRVSQVFDGKPSSFSTNIRTMRRSQSRRVIWGFDFSLRDHKARQQMKSSTVTALVITFFFPRCVLKQILCNSSLQNCESLNMMPSLASCSIVA